MKTTLALLAVLAVAPAAAFAQGARLQLDSLDRLKVEASDVVDVDVDEGLLQMAFAFIPKNQPDAAKVKTVIGKLKGIYVRRFEFDRDRVLDDDIDRIRRQLTGGNWARVVNVDNRRDRELVEVHMWRDGANPGGFAILYAKPTELTVVNIVGPLDLASLAALQGMWGIPELPQAGNPGDVR